MEPFHSVFTVAVAVSVPETCLSVLTSPACAQAASSVPSIVGAVSACWISMKERASTRVSVPMAPGSFQPVVALPSVAVMSNWSESFFLASLSGMWTTASQPPETSLTTPVTSPVPLRLNE